MFPKSLLVNKSSSKGSEESFLKAILEVTFRERNLFTKIDDVTTTLMKENGIRTKISYLNSFTTAKSHLKSQRT